MSLPALRLAVCVAVTFGCARPPTPAAPVPLLAYFQTVPSLRAIGAVRPGMRLDELRTERPSAMPADYVGLHEAVGADTIRYWLPEGDAESIERRFRRTFAAPSGATPLLAVDASSRYATPEEASAALRERAATLSRLGPARCFDIRGHRLTYRAVLLEIDSLTLGAMLTPAQDITGMGGTSHFPATVRSFAAHDLTRVIPGQLPRDSIPCAGP